MIERDDFVRAYVEFRQGVNTAEVPPHMAGPVAQSAQNAELIWERAAEIARNRTAG